MIGLAIIIVILLLSLYLNHNHAKPTLPPLEWEKLEHKVETLGPVSGTLLLDVG